MRNNFSSQNMKPIINLTSITNYLQTKYSIQEVLSSLDKVEAEMFKKRQAVYDILDKYAPFPLSDSLKKLAQEHEVDLQSHIEADNFFGKVREAITKLPMLTITIGTPPTLELIKEINGWVLANIKGFVAIDFVVDKSLIAGATINFNGKARDYSVKKETLGVATVENTEIG